MERLYERLTLAKKALLALEEVACIEQPSTVERDAAIQRFEFTFEAVWKAAKLMLYESEGIDVGSPKGVIRACREIGLYDEKDTILALQMVDDRNLTTHTYNEALAIEIYRKLASYAPLLKKWLKGIATKIVNE